MARRCARRGMRRLIEIFFSKTAITYPFLNSNCRICQYSLARSQQFPKFIMWQLIVLENKRLKQWGIIKGEKANSPPWVAVREGFPSRRNSYRKNTPGVSPGIFIPAKKWLQRLPLRWHPNAAGIDRFHFANEFLQEIVV